MSVRLKSKCEINYDVFKNHRKNVIAIKKDLKKVKNGFERNILETALDIAQDAVELVLMRFAVEAISPNKKLKVSRRPPDKD